MDTDAPPEQSKLAGDVPTRKPRGLKIALIVVAVLFVLFACTIIFLPSILPVDMIRGIAKNQARELAGVDVDFTNLRFGWNGDVVVDGISVAPVGPDGAPGETLLKVDEVRTNVALLPLLSGKAVINSVEVNGYVVTLRRDADGTLNIPDISRGSTETAGAALAAARPRSGVLPLFTAARAGETAPALPPIEVHNLRLNKGTIAFHDAITGMLVDFALPRVQVRGGSLNDPFAFEGLLLPHPDRPDLGEIPFSGNAAMLKNGALDLNGKANLEATLRNISLPELAGKAGIDNLLHSGTADGPVKAGYAAGIGGLTVTGMTLNDIILPVGGVSLELPDTTASLDASFDPGPGEARISSASIANELVSATASGRVGGFHALADGGLPVADVDFSGTADISGISHFLSTNDFGLPELPELQGQGEFVGKATLPEAQPGQQPAPSLALELTNGEVSLIETNTGIVARVGLKGIGLQAVTALAQSPAFSSRVVLNSVPVRAIVPDLSDEAVTAQLTGGVAFEHNAASTAAEIRMTDVSAAVPATPWFNRANVGKASAHIVADFVKDAVVVQSLEAVVNNTLRCASTGGNIQGVLAGVPKGAVTLQLAGGLGDVRELAGPSFPAELLPQVAGDLQATTQIKFENNTAEAAIRSEVSNIHTVIAIEPGRSGAEIRAPKAGLSVHASANLATPHLVSIHALEATGTQADVAYRDPSVGDLSGRIGEAVLKTAGTLDLAAGKGELGSFASSAGGLNLTLAREGTPVATLSTGTMAAAVDATQQKLVFPLASHGDFTIPVTTASIENLVVQSSAGGTDQSSNLGSIRAQFTLGGYLGNEKRQLISMSAAFSSPQARATSRAQVDLGTTAFLADYNAQVSPAALAPILAVMGLPPSFLTNAEAGGVLSFDGTVLAAKGNAKGQLNTGGNQTAPFEMAHDLSAAWNEAQRSLAIEVRTLQGNVKTASGEPVVTLTAKPSQLVLSAAGSRGAIDLRINGAAEPTRTLILGFTGMLPQLAAHTNILYNARADGVYNAWLVVSEKDPVTLSLNVGGTWKGAALQLEGKPFLSEAGELAAAMEGELAYRDHTLTLSRLFLKSDSARIQAEGNARAVYTADENMLPTGLAHIATNLSFSVADVARAGMVFPGVLPADLGMSGAITGGFQAGGDAHDVKINQSVVRFQNFRALPAESLEVTIPAGEATLGATLGLHFSGASTGSPFDIFKMFDVRGGQAALTGALVKGKQVSNLTAAFQLERGVLGITGLQVAIGGGEAGSVSLTGSVDFNPPQPAVAARVAMRNIALSDFNSEIQDFMRIESGSLHMPAQEGQAAGLAFSGLSEDDILRTLRLDNFTFATGPIKLHTGPKLNKELDRARLLMKQSVESDGSSREITFKSVTGSALADGSGVIAIPESNPINVFGDNTGDFRAQGTVRADHTIDMRVMVAGGFDKLIGFSLPSLIPNLGGSNSQNASNFMATLNQNAAKGRYGVTVSGNLDDPQIGGIPELVGVLLGDLALAFPGQIVGGVLNLAKDTPGALINLGGNVVEGILNPADTIKNAPENIVKAPGNVVKGLGQMFGIGGRAGDAAEGGDGQEGESGQQENRDDQRPRLRLPFGR